jgi:glucan phosphoethanolaminetransferase (alkaline phosphatase superfamily)
VSQAAPNARRLLLLGAAPDTEARVIALSLFSALYCVGLQVARMGLRADEVWTDTNKAGVTDFLAFLSSSMLLQVGLATSSFGFLLLLRNRSLRTAGTVLLQAFMLLLLAVETGAHAYFFVTGQTLDWPLFEVALSHPQALLALGSGSVPQGIWVALLVLGFAVVLVPWVVAARARRRKADLAVLSHSRPTALALCAAGLVVMPLGLLPSSRLATDAASPRDPVLNLFASALRGQTTVREGVAPIDPNKFFDVAIAPVPAPAGGPPRKARNLVMIILESTRASATTLHDPSLPTTPFLQELAPKSLKVERMQAVIPATKKALRHMLCGFESSHSPRPQALTLGLMTRCLPNLLVQQGYDTVFFQSADEHWDFRTASAFSMGFLEFKGPSSFDRDGWERPNLTGWDDEIMLPASRQWLKAHKKKPFMATYLTVDAHFECKPITRRGQLRLSGDDALDCYLNAVRHDDFFVHELIRQYQDLGLAEDTLFVITADHGEAFGEHGRRTHNDIPWQEALHVPVLIYDPNGVNPAPGLVPGNWAQTDLAPTIVDLLGYRITRGGFQGSSVLRPPPPHRVIHSACMGEDMCVASLEGDRKLVHHFWHKKPELYDLKADPLEKHNLAEQFPDELKRRTDDVLLWDDDVKQRYAWFELHRNEPLGR